MKLPVIAYTTHFIINFLLGAANGQAWNPGYAQGNNGLGLPLNNFYHGLRNQIAGSLLGPPATYNYYGAGAGYQDVYRQQSQGGLNYNFGGGPGYPQNQGQNNFNPNGFAQQGNAGQNFQGPQNYNNLPGQQGSAQQNQNIPVPPPPPQNNPNPEVHPGTPSAQPGPGPVQVQSNLASEGQGALPGPSPDNAPSNPGPPQENRQELPVAPNPSTPNSEDALVLKEFNETAPKS